MFLVAGAACSCDLQLPLEALRATVCPTRFSIELTKVGSLLPAGSVLAVSPDGSQVVYTGLQRAYLRLLSEFDMKVISGTEGQGLRSPVFSPDGKSIAFFSSMTVRSNPTCRRITNPDRTRSRSVGIKLV